MDGASTSQPKAGTNSSKGDAPNVVNGVEKEQHVQAELNVEGKQLKQPVNQGTKSSITSNSLSLSNSFGALDDVSGNEELVGSGANVDEGVTVVDSDDEEVDEYIEMLDKKQKEASTSSVDVSDV